MRPWPAQCEQPSHIDSSPQILWPLFLKCLLQATAFFLFLSCVGVCVIMYVPIYDGTCVCICREAQGRCWESSWITFHHIDVGRVFWSKPEPAIWLVSPASLLHGSTSLPSRAGITGGLLDICYGFWRSKFQSSPLHRKHFRNWVAQPHVLHCEAYHKRAHNWLGMATHLGTTNGFRTCNNQKLIETQMHNEPQAFLSVFNHVSLYDVSSVWVL